MSRLVANATKPRKNESRIVDLNMKNLRSELTVTIPQNDIWTGGLRLIGTDGEGDDQKKLYIDVQSRNILSCLSENLLMQNFCACFDQFKLMNSHFCIDITQLPMIRYWITRMWCQRQYFQWAENPNAVEWTDIDGPVGDWLTQDMIDQLEVHFPSTPGYVLDERDPGNVDEWDDKNVFQLELPFTLGASARRTIPNGFFQTDVNNPYEDPTWDQMASYGSFIYQSKMPGSGVHLSLDISGSSNSERMMCFPSAIVNRLYHVKPSNQNGRFCPVIMIGIKVNFPSVNQLKSQLYQMVDKAGSGYYWLQSTSDFKYSNGWQYLKVNTTTTPRYIRIKCNYSFTSDGETEMTPIEFENSTQSSNFTYKSYAYSVQAYHQVRFKQLRSIAGERSYEYNFLGAQLCNAEGNIYLNGLDFLDSLAIVSNNPATTGKMSWVNFQGQLVEPLATDMPADFKCYFIVCYKKGVDALDVTTYCRITEGSYGFINLHTFIDGLSADTKASYTGFSLLGIRATVQEGQEGPLFDRDNSFVVFTKDRQPSVRDVMLLSDGTLADVPGIANHHYFSVTMKSSTITLFDAIN